MLREALALDPERSNVRERLAELERSAREARYSAEVRAAESALSAGELVEARRRARSAQRLAPERDLEYLFKRIEAQEEANAVARQLAAARDAFVARDWVRARDAYGAVLVLDPTNAEAVEREALAANVVTALTRVDRYLAAPLRLASDEVAQAARSELIRAAPFAADSEVLRERLAELAEYLEQREVPAAVTVLSDGRTEVTVRRVGQVGRTERKVIQLTPGEYDFEGSRSGYKSTLVRLTIPFGATTAQVRVVCDEPV